MRQEFIRFDFCMNEFCLIYFSLKCPCSLAWTRNGLQQTAILFAFCTN